MKGKLILCPGVFMYVLVNVNADSLNGRFGHGSEAIAVKGM